MRLTKYRFLQGIKCLKALFLEFNNPELKVPLTEEQKNQFDNGKKVGMIGRHIYHGGIDLSEEGKTKGEDLIKETNNAFLTEQQIFYEPAFKSSDGNLFFQADIFVRAKKRILIVEIKSSTSIKEPDHIYDIGFQWKVLKENGYGKNTEFFIGYLNKEYVRQGDLEIEKLFILENVTSKAKRVQPLINRYFIQFKNLLNKKQAPQVEIGEHCFKPYPCEFMKHCWKKLPDFNVWNIGGIRKKHASKMFSDGIIEPAQIPRHIKLKETQWIEIDSTIENKPSINKREINNFLDSLNLDEPLFFMDFETMMPAIPIYNGTRPYQHICFQYCVLHIQNQESEIDRREFLAEPKIDPRKAFLINLLNATKGKGNIVVYNEAFEISRLRELALLFPDYAIEISERIGRIKDLMIPFSKKFYYHPSFKGKYSIKVILPIMCPELSYNDLQINNGKIAMIKYEMLHTHSLKEQLETKKALKEYCFMDVFGMVKILESLQQL